jgi:hypothetical protein
MDVRYDLEHGVWGNGSNGLAAPTTNVLTLARSVSVWHGARAPRRVRRALSESGRPRDLFRHRGDAAGGRLGGRRVERPA